MIDVYCDPGVWTVGLTAAEGPKLLGAWFFDSEEANVATRGRLLFHAFNVECHNLGIGMGGMRLFLEKPQVYKTSPGDPNDLIDVTLTAGCFAGAMMWSSVKTFWPFTWKGNMKKEICTKHIKKRRTPEEIEIMKKTAKRRFENHNLLDSFGMFLYHQGRF